MPATEALITHQQEVTRRSFGGDEQFFLQRDVLSTIFTYLTFPEIASCCRVSKVWAQCLPDMDHIIMELGKRGAVRVAMLEFATKYFRNLATIEIIFPNRLDALHASCTGTRLAIRDLLSKNYRQLQHFYFEGRYNVLGFTLEPLGNATNLRSLTLDRYRFACLDELMTLLDDKPNLRSFACKNLKFCSFHNALSLHDLYNSFIHFRIGNMHNLRELTLLLDDIHFAEDSLDWSILFSKLVKLERLEIDYLDDTGTLALAQYCPNLRFLDLDLCYNVSFPSVLEVLTRCPIETLKIFNVVVRAGQIDPNGRHCMYRGPEYVREMCQKSDTLIHLKVSPYFGEASYYEYMDEDDEHYDDNNEHVNNNEHDNWAMMVQAALDASEGRVNLTFG
mmetsp:Transcript_17046/g.26597  ORF Transcript_17046/g.26597 Transcript_17046/m.26597 type:complete len:391 (-) Transcript_17046:46-1218(-)